MNAIARVPSGARVPVHRSRSAILRGRAIVKASAKDELAVMVNSCTGKMGLAAAEAVVRGGFTLVPYTLTGSSIGVAVQKQAVEGIPVEVVGPDSRQEAMEMILEKYPRLVVVDYTLPSAVNENAEFYCKNKIPFVMGTTGGDKNKLFKVVEESGNYAVIAPNMGKQIVAFQAMMEFMGEKFPGAFSGYTLDVKESHQKTKVDTSGTAKAVVESFVRMGTPFDVEDIVKVRDEAGQLSMGVPKENLSGHAYHTYRLTSGDGSVTFEFQHNVRGRVVYAEGTVDAALFLRKQIDKGSEKKIFNMIDVLEAGAMR